ncbi:MAG: hypothetical protein LAP39_06960 [Acidobacteriia bacterium]|nr:hypothetical protein [Terriglobia bacterium]
MPSVMRRVALVLALVWAGWWVFFASADALMSHEFAGAITLAVVTIGTLAVAWKWPAVGGVLLVLASITSIGMWAPMWIRRFDFWQILVLFAIMPLPPLVAGVLLLLSTHRHTPARPVHVA